MKKILYLILIIEVMHSSISCKIYKDKFVGVWIPIKYTDYYEMEILKSGEIYIIKYSYSSEKEIAEYEKGKLVVRNYFRDEPKKYFFYDEIEDHLIYKDYYYQNEFYRKR